MIAFDPRDAIPYEWSLRPADTLGLEFWTKSPEALVRDMVLLRPYRVRVHVTITGWTEVEKGAPDVIETATWTRRLVRLIGAKNVTWRFSPVPLVDDVVDRFTSIAAGLQHLVHDVFLSFLQPNDKVPETRGLEERLEIMTRLSDVAARCGMSVFLCNEDMVSLRGIRDLPDNLRSGICSPSFVLGQLHEKCGCALAIDPFTINESCAIACTYCYVSDGQRKRNTTKDLITIGRVRA
jgi:hypothetical protein